MWTTFYDGDDSAFISPNQIQIIDYDRDLGTGARATATGLYESYGDSLNSDILVIHSVKNNGIESNINYSDLNEWNFHTTDKKEINGIYELVVEE